MRPEGQKVDYILVFLIGLCIGGAIGQFLMGQK